MNGVKANKENLKRFDLISQLGCIVCYLQGIFSECEIHHTEGCKTQEAHTKTIGLCFLHHREGSNKEEWVSRHPHKAEFERRYGTEQELLAITNELLEVK